MINSIWTKDPHTPEATHELLHYVTNRLEQIKSDTIGTPKGFIDIMARLYDNFAELKRRIQSDPSKSGFQHAIEMATSSKEEVDPSDPKSLAELGFGFELMFIPEACGWCYPPEAEQDRRHKILNEHRSWRS